MSARSRRCSTWTSTVIEKLIGEQFKGKDKLIAPNIKALHLGRDYAHAQPRTARSGCGCSKRRQGRRPHLHRGQRGRGARRGLWRRDGLRLVSDHAVVLARRGLHPPLRASCASIRRPSRANYAIVQAEDELASIGMVIGAGWNGARAFTATSGPGISLMQEFIGLAYFAEIPAVIFDVQRAGPSTGMPTRTQQSDILSCAYASHGDTKHVLLFPEDPARSLRVRRAGVRSRRPAADADLRHARSRHRHERSALPRRSPGTTPRDYDRGKVMTAEELEAGKEFGRYLDVDGDGIPYRTYPGTHPTKGSFFTRGTSRDRYARYTEEGAPTSTTCSGCCASSRPPRTWCRGRCRRNAAQADEIRRDLLRLDRAGDGRGDRHARGAAAIALDRMRVRAFPFHSSVDELRRRPRLRVRGRAEPRRAVALAARQRMRHRSGAAGADPALRRHADHRALHRQGDRRPSRRAEGHAAARWPS